MSTVNGNVFHLAYINPGKQPRSWELVVLADIEGDYLCVFIFGLLNSILVLSCLPGLFVHSTRPP